jgi:aryl-alcohol dehydrogenase-like predicted oxidoreductase
MRYRLFGSSGLRVSELALGTMTFGEAWGWGAAPEECRRIFDRFVELGGNFIDTANNYTDGESEQIVGGLIASERDRFVLATKYTLSTRIDDPNAGGNHRKNMVQAVEASLRRLGTDRIDLYWVHMWDGMTPVDEVVRALDDLVRAGKILHVGASDTPAWVVARGIALAELRGWSPFVGIQAPYSLADRGIERELLPMARASGLTLAAWGLLEGGGLTGKYLDSTGEPRRYSEVSDRVQSVAREVVAVASEMGCSPTQVALAWVRRQSWPIVPIVGARTLAQVDDALGCLDVVLPDEQLARLTPTAPIDLGFPRSFLESDDVQELIFGATGGMIDPVV